MHSVKGMTQYSDCRISYNCNYLIKNDDEPTGMRCKMSVGMYQVKYLNTKMRPWYKDVTIQDSVLELDILVFPCSR